MAKKIGKFLHDQADKGFTRYNGIVDGEFIENNDQASPQQTRERKRSQLIRSVANIFYDQDFLLEDELVDPVNDNY